MSHLRSHNYNSHGAVHQGTLLGSSNGHGDSKPDSFDGGFAESGAGSHSNPLPSAFAATGIYKDSFREDTKTAKNTGGTSNDERWRRGTRTQITTGKQKAMATGAAEFLGEFGIRVETNIEVQETFLED
jgi:hypothetical protein